MRAGRSMARGRKGGNHADPEDDHPEPHLGQEPDQRPFAVPTPTRTEVFISVPPTSSNAIAPEEGAQRESRRRCQRWEWE